MNKDISQLKRQLFGAILSVAVSFVALSSSTYAWYVSNKTVQGTTSTISAQADGAVLQINAGKVADHDGDAATVAMTEGHGISPASSEDMVNWYVPASWTANLAKVSSYNRVTLETDANGDKDGTYKIGGTNYYAYAVGTYTIFSVKNTGFADVYFDGAAEGGPIVVTRAGQTGTVSDKVAASMRVGITINDTLVAVFAPAEPNGAGNDVNYEGSNPSNGWRVVKGGEDTSSTTKDAGYTHITGDGTGADGWALCKNAGGIYNDPTSSQIKIASSVDYNGVIMKVYVWMEGTDADCLGSIVTGDESLYDVSVRLVGLSTGSGT